MAGIGAYFEQLASNSQDYSAALVDDLTQISTGAENLNGVLQGVFAVEYAEFATALVEGLNEAVSAAQVFSETLQVGIQLDLSALGEEGLLGQLSLLSESTESVGTFFQAVRAEVDQTVLWISMSGQLLNEKLAMQQEEGALGLEMLLANFASRNAANEENRALEDEGELLAQETKLGSLQQFLDTGFALREQGMLSEQTLQTAFQETGLLSQEQFEGVSLVMKAANAFDLVSTEKDSQDAQNAVAEASFSDKMQMAGQLLGGLSGLMQSESKEAFMIGKAAAIAEAGINSALGAIQAYTSMTAIPFVGPALGAIAAAAVVAAGAKSINDIRSQQPGSGKKPTASFPKPNLNPKTAAPKLSIPSLPSAGKSAVGGGGGGAGSSTLSVSPAGGKTKIKIFVADKAIIDTEAVPGKDGRLIVRAAA